MGTFGSGGLNSNYLWLELPRREEEVPLSLTVYESINIEKKCITWPKSGLESQSTLQSSIYYKY